MQVVEQEDKDSSAYSNHKENALAGIMLVHDAQTNSEIVVIHRLKLKILANINCS